MQTKSPIEAAQPNKSGVISTKMYDMADKIDGTKQPQLNEAFNGAAREFADENYDKGQRILEANGFWNDEVRGLASEANQAGREKVGASSLGFDQAKAAMSGYAKNLESLGERQDIEGAMQIEGIIRGMDRPGETGIDGVNEALKYIEGLLQTKNRLEQKMTPEMKKQWEEQRAVRDSLLAEKRKRVEQFKKDQKIALQLTAARSSTSRVLENLYADAGVPEETSSRQAFFRRLGSMTPEELNYLNEALRRTMAEFQRNRDAKSLDAALMDLSLRKFTKEEALRIVKQKEEARVEEIKRELDEKMGAKQPEKKPEIKLKLEKITDENFERYHQQNKEVMFNGQAWRIDEARQDGSIFLHRDIEMSEAIKLAEESKRGEIPTGRGGIDQPGVKTKARRVSLEELKSSAQWIVEKPPRPPEDSDRQKEVEETRELQRRLTSGEFSSTKNGEFELLSEVFEKNAVRLNAEKQAYEKTLETKQ